jgi:hypothetical protein
MRKTFPILMMNQGCFTFSQKLFRSNDHFSKKIFGQMTIFRKKCKVFGKVFGKAFGQMTLQSNDNFSKKAFGHMLFWSFD